MSARMLIFMIFIFNSILVKADTKYLENVHYTVIDEEYTPQLVEEVFSYFCIHCYRFQSIMHNLQEKKQSGVVFKKNYISHFSEKGPLINQVIAKARLIAESNKVGDEFDKAVFQAIHGMKLTIKSEDDLNNVLQSSGLQLDISDVSMHRYDIDKSFEIIKERNLMFVNNKYVTSLPAVIVQGKYRVNISSLDAGDISNEFYNLVDYLLSKNN
jgi:thiol:disulfide interchange protein DsbA